MKSGLDAMPLFLLDDLLNKTIDRAIILLAMFCFLCQLIEKVKEDAQSQFQKCQFTKNNYFLSVS